MWQPNDLKSAKVATPFFLMAGPCVIESRQMVFEIAETMLEITRNLGIPYIFKASFDKANRTSHQAFRGCGIDKGLNILADIKKQLNVPVVTDVHDVHMVPDVASVVDVLQVPAFLCRQTDLIQAVMGHNCAVNLKKGQFLSPWDMQAVLNKAQSFGDNAVWLCERGATFGYQNLVVDMRSLAVMRQLGVPIVFDATHSVQQPGGLGASSGGQREFIPALARAAVAVGVDGLFMETHPEPNKALSDGPNSVPLSNMLAFLTELTTLAHSVQSIKQPISLSSA